MQGPASSLRPAALRAATALACLLAGAPAADAVEPNIHLHPSVWLANLTGDGETGGGGSSREFDVDETLGLDTDETVPSFDGFVRVGKSRFILSWNRGGYDGDNRLDDDLGFKGITFPAGGKLRSEVDYDRRRALYGRPIVDMKRAAVGFLIGVEAYDVEAHLRMQGIGRPEASLDSKVPIVGASFTFHPTAGVRLYAEATGISWERGGIDSKLLDAYGAAEYTFLGQALAVSLGYRYAFLNGEEEDSEKFVFRQEGLFVGLVLML